MQERGGGGRGGQHPERPQGPNPGVPAEIINSPGMWARPMDLMGFHV